MSIETNPVEDNLERLQSIQTTIMSDLMGQHAIYNGQDPLLVPVSEDTEALFDRNAAETTAKLDKLPSKIGRIAWMIRLNNFETPIDVEFVSTLIDNLEDTPEDKNNEPGLELETFKRFSEELELRKIEHEVIEELQAYFSVDISGERSLGVTINPENTHADLNLPLETDPETFPVELGPNAVFEILGGALTDEDYETICKMLISLPGEIGESIRIYHEASTLWAADYAENGRDNPELLANRRIATRAVLSAFKFSPHTDIPLNAVFTTAMREHGLAFPANQPYVN